MLVLKSTKIATYHKNLLITIMRNVQNLVITNVNNAV